MFGAGTAQAQSVDTKIAVNSQTDDKTFVVIISNENYKHEESVPFARNDGEVFKVYCQKTLGIPEDHIRFAPDATLGEMNYAIYWLGNILKAYDGEAKAIVYYSGHGMPDEEGKDAYLLPVDGFCQSVEGALSTKTLYKRLGEMNSQKIILFLDACFSGAKRDGKMLASSRGVAIKVKVDPVGDNTVVFSAAQGDETAYPFKSQKHGLFTYYVLDKMQQSGGCTTLGELSDYVTQNVKRKAVVENNGKSQTPTIIASSGNNSWRDWRFAASAAKKFEDRVVTNDQPAAKPSPALVVNPETEPMAQPQSAENATSKPLISSAALSELVLEGKKAMRAMDYQKAQKCLSQAAEQGHVEANYQLGLLYSNSNFDGYDKEKATKYFTAAANGNHMEAMYQTGMMYLGTDNATAKIWFRKAAEGGHVQAIKQLSRLR
ncbi:MAG: caspase family protein [Bacteroidaceae bacterium]|nr:caspase family protein [Bacteroidaceae bacterium]